ncbi:MAG: DNRLRE domain-containing protein, partial [Actinomycetota bacterium]|nr:DNRLRE domain-containing protein [Actinomycetota bacterium]
LLQLGDTGGQWWTNTNLLMQAASNVDPDFNILLMPDMAGSVGTKSQDTLAKYVAQLGKYPSAHRLADGRLVVSPFYAEKHDAAWWATFLNVMKTTYATPVAFVPVFLNERANADAFASISYGMSNWGDRNPQWNDPYSPSSTSRISRINTIHAMGKMWMQPVSVQDERPRSGVFDESENTTNLRYTWKIAMDSKSEWVQLPTWNDYAEGTQFAPSAKHGWTFLDINAYYLSWYKTGVRPTIVRDTVYVTHRTQPHAAKPTFAQTKLMALRGGSPARDTVEALTFLTAPATVKVQVGSKAYLCQAEAGVDTCTVPLGTGRVSATVVRNGATVTGVVSRHEVTATPYVQDLQYVAESSGRATATDLAVSAPTSLTLVPKVVKTTATADTYANQGAPSMNYGGSTSLFSRNSPGQVSYLRFSIPSTPFGTRLAGAALRLRTVSDATAGSVDPSTVAVASDSWVETGVTWDTRPSVSTSKIGTVPAGTSAATVYDVALDVSAMSAFAGSQRTLAVTNTSADNLWFWSSEHANRDYVPQLVFTYLPVDVDNPSTPGAVRATVSGGDKVALSWSPSTDDRGVTGYDVHRARTSAATPSAETLIGSTTIAGYTETQVPAGTWYYRVVARDAAGNRSATSGEAAAFVADTTAPAVPSSPAGTVVTVDVRAVSGELSGSRSSTVELTWADSPDNVATVGYDVYRSKLPDDAPSDQNLIGSSPVAAFADSSVPPGIWYYRVVAKDAAGNRSAGSGDVRLVVADTTAPSSPADVRASSSGSTVTLSWGAATDDIGVVRYDVHRSATAGFTPSSQTRITSVETTGFADSAVPAGTWYYRIVARDAAGNVGAASPGVSSTVLAPVVATIEPVADTYGNAGAPAANYGSSSSLTSRGSIGAVSYLRFVLPAAPPGTSLRSATLQLRTTGDSFAGSQEIHSVQLAADTWSESTLTWNNRAGVTAGALGSLPAGTAPATGYRIPLTTAAVQQLLGSTRTVAITNTGTDSVWFWSRNHASASYRPRLVLTFE